MGARRAGVHLIEHLGACAGTPKGEADDEGGEMMRGWASVRRAAEREANDEVEEEEEEEDEEEGERLRGRHGPCGKC